MLPWWPLTPWLLALTPRSIRWERFMPLPLPFFPSQSQSIFAKVTKAMCLTPSPNEQPHCQPLIRNGLPQRDCALRKASLLSFSCKVMPESLQPHGVQHARLPCLSPPARVYWNSCPLNQWCIKPFHPLPSLSPPAFNLSQHQGLFKWVSSSHQVAKTLEFQHQHQSFQWTPRTDFL